MQVTHLTRVKPVSRRLSIKRPLFSARSPPPSPPGGIIGKPRGKTDLLVLFLEHERLELASGHPLKKIDNLLLDHERLGLGLGSGHHLRKINNRTYM